MGGSYNIYLDCIKEDVFWERVNDVSYHQLLVDLHSFCSRIRKTQERYHSGHIQLAWQAGSTRQLAFAIYDTAEPHQGGGARYVTMYRHGILGYLPSCRAVQRQAFFLIQGS